MKYMFASDIHGSAFYCRQLITAFEKERPEKLVLLGDLLYHGPRNDLPKDYNPKSVIEMLNSIADKIVCVRGNCEAEVDQMVLDFPCMADYILIMLDCGKTAFVTHGHHYSAENLPSLEKNDYFICGHTHIKANTKVNGINYINPGSVSIPKDDSRHCYVLYENGVFSFSNLN